MSFCSQLCAVLAAAVPYLSITQAGRSLIDEAAKAPIQPKYSGTSTFSQTSLGANSTHLRSETAAPVVNVPNRRRKTSLTLSFCFAALQVRAHRNGAV